MNENIRYFFETYAKATNNSDVNMVSKLYSDIFMFGKPNGVQSVRKEDFLKVLPKRKEFITSVGLKETSLLSFEETQLYNSYILVKTTWNFHYEKSGKIIDDPCLATYILFKNGNSFEIVFQLDGQDLMERVKKLELL